MQDPAHNDQLLNEIQGLSKARSRHVVEIYDIVKSKDGTVSGIVIELLKGRDFLTFHLEAASNITAYLRVLYQIARGLSDLHAHGITHRDIKLENIKESASGIVKIFDFGLSVAGNSYHTKNNRGTLVYAAPELYISGAQITPMMDVYAFGVCAWALIADTFPKELLKRPPDCAHFPSIDSFSPGLIPPGVVAIIDSCLSKDPARRPSSSEVSTIFAKHLVKDKHKGIFVKDNQQLFELSAAQKNVRIKTDPLGEIRAAYDGLSFRITNVSGDVYINNVPVLAGVELHEACVITFGRPERKWNRSWVSFSSSHPEVVL